MFKINLFDPWVLKLEVGQNANTSHGFSVFQFYSNLSIYHKHFYTHSNIIAIMKPFRNLTLGKSIILYDDLVTNYTFLSFQFIYLYGHKAVSCHPAYLTYMQSTSWETLGWMKRCSTSFAVRRRKSKRGWEATSRPLGWLLSKANNCWGARGETRALTRCCWKQSTRVASASSPAAPTGGEQRPLDAAVLLPGIYSGQLKTSVHAKIYVNVHSSYIHNKQKSGNNPNGHQQVNG